MSKLQKQVWTTLSAIDCSEHIEKKNGLSYLSWAWAYQMLMDNYPNNDYTFEESEHANGTVMVTCTVTIFEGEESATRMMWLPVMDYRNKAIPNPDSFAINTARMRAFCKCLSMHGLGAYIYAGEDVPKATKEAEAEENAEKLVQIKKLIGETQADVAGFCKAFQCNSIDTIHPAKYEEAIKALLRKKEKQGE